ncbi:hypothetical protein [Puniceicoccus vermicola]|uniref:Uncharacterized protein n=1 Tax=Puniceicoccus vermicola TaxID=388746 RepID=A0A7X1E3N5_9BACT|nr:hypothetical protein [Puniceicoccus vermicola]MBC2601251.1 hypothetical protein [Puniceicoccus vermicola]
MNTLNHAFEPQIWEAVGFIYLAKDATNYGASIGALVFTDCHREISAPTIPGVFSRIAIPLQDLFRSLLHELMNAKSRGHCEVDVGPHKERNQSYES